MPKPLVAVTIGDPAGIGPEIVFRAATSYKVKRVCSPVIFGDKNILSKYPKHINTVISSNLDGKISIGKPSKLSGLIACSAIKKATELCLAKQFNALVTAPVSKESLKFAGLKYPGHTELLADLTKTKKYAMLMVCHNINSVMVTRHIPISEVSNHLSPEAIIDTITTAVSFFNKLSAFDKPIAVCALNPHASDNGILGSEEENYIIPAIQKLRKLKLPILGPLPADSAWLKAKEGTFSLIVCMYHDQTMIPLKCINANKIINVTAGLPFIRTSPGHGTAFDIAGKNCADETAMIESILYAAKHSNKQL